jgi:hypothetical protein
MRNLNNRWITALMQSDNFNGILTRAAAIARETALADQCPGAVSQHHKDLAARSTSGRHIVVERASHDSMLFDFPPINRVSTCLHESKDNKPNAQT